MFIVIMGEFVHLAIYTWTHMRCWHSKYYIHTHQLVVHTGCWHSCRTIWHCTVVVSSALPYIHTTICWYVHCHLTMFTDMLLMWASHRKEGLPFFVHFDWHRSMKESGFGVSCKNAYHIAGKFGGYWSCQNRGLANFFWQFCLRHK